MKMYKVTQAIWGADRSVDLYFETKEEATKYYNAHDYCDKPVPQKVPENKVKELLESTMFYL